MCSRGVPTGIPLGYLCLLGLCPDLPLYPIVVSPRKHCERLQVVVADPKQPISSKNTPRQQRRLTQIVVAEILSVINWLLLEGETTFESKTHRHLCLLGRCPKPCRYGLLSHRLTQRPPLAPDGALKRRFLNQKLRDWRQKHPFSPRKQYWIA